MTPAQKYAAEAEERATRAAKLRDELMALRNGGDAPCLTIGDENTPDLYLIVAANGGLKVEANSYDHAITADQAIEAARWILATFEVNP